MILTGHEIAAQVRRGRIRISDFTEDKLSPNSYDLTLGPVIRRHAPGILDPRIRHALQTIEIPPAGHPLDADELVLGESVERIATEHFVPILHARSGVARIGLFVHVTGDLLQLGFDGHPVLQLFATLPVLLRRAMPITQISFWRPEGAITTSLQELRY
jgi:dCTP deaminase